MMKGVDREAAITIDIEDKITVLEEEDTPENQVKVALRGLTSMIGETSNCATSYHNRVPESKETAEKYESYVSLLSVINGKAVDQAKTGIVYTIPRHIAKYGKKLPYFMKYASPYYASMKTFSHARSNMNRLCKEIETWHKSVKWMKPFSRLTASKSMQDFEYYIDTKSNMNRAAEPTEFDYTIMMDQSIPINEYKLQQIEQIYLQFNKESRELIKEFKDSMLKAANKKQNKSSEFVDSINWQGFYNSYRMQCFDICPDICELANYATIICYELYPKRKKGFLWNVAGEGILANLKQTEQYLPMRDPDGEYEYLGNRYRLERIVFDK